MRRRFCRPPRLNPPAEPPLRLLRTAEAAPTARRFLALHFPWLATEGLGDGPLLLWHSHGSKRLVAAVDPAAAEAGLSPGQALADAQAMVPGIRVLPDDPERQAARLTELGLWALRVTPLVMLAAPDGLVLDITGVPHLFGGETAVLRRAMARLRQFGHASQGTVAGTPLAALAVARTHPGGFVLAPGQEEAALGPLPLAALRLPEDVSLGLRRLGLYRLGEVLAQPRAPLTRRFGAALTLALDTALGLVAPPFRALRPPPDFTAARELLEPLITRTGIDALVGQLLPELCAQLAEAGQGLRQLRLLAYRVDGGVQEIVLGIGQPSRDPRHLGRLLDGRLETLEPGFGFDRLVLQAERTGPLSAAQSGLDGAAGAEALAELLDRLTQRLPVWRLQPRASHWPERAVTRVGAFTPVVPLPGWATRPRPLRLLRRPERIEVLAAFPDSPPRQLRWRRVLYHVARAESAERFEAEWWRDRPDRPARDYYRIELENGVRLWVCRVGVGEWYLHGFLA